METKTEDKIEAKTKKERKGLKGYRKMIFGIVIVITGLSFIGVTLFRIKEGLIDNTAGVDIIKLLANMIITVTGFVIAGNVFGDHKPIDIKK